MAICYGFLANGRTHATLEECEEELEAEANKMSNYIDTHYNRSFTWNQKAALMSYHFNVKARSTIHAKYRANNGYSDVSIANAIMKYGAAECPIDPITKKEKCKKLRGLVERRKEEAELFLNS